MNRHLTILFSLIFAFGLEAQIIEIPLPRKFKEADLTNLNRQSNQTQNSLLLPFWDDFSLSRLQPSTELWESGETVRISNGIGVNPPSLNVAVFDGVNAFGAPYDATSLINGRTDSLVSKPIDLSVVAANQADSVFMSFFWQINGNGELPDSEDSLVLQFKRPDETWRTVWSQTGGIDNESEEFEQELIQISNSYFSENFQFRFQSYSRLAGPFDTWLIDYILIDDSRFATDIAYRDRALTKKPSFLIGPYASMPTEQFFANPERYLQETQVEFLNLNSSFQPVQFNTDVVNGITGDLIEQLNVDVVANPLPDAFERRIFTSPALDPTNLDQNADSLWLETSYNINTGDNFLIESIRPGIDTVFNSQVDFRINDTVMIRTIIDDYFAYDDGEPDFAAGINQNGGQLAVAFFAEERALLTHIDINFPFIQQAGEPIELFVWERLRNEPDAILFQDPFSVLRPDEIGDLRAYQLDTPVFVQDTFYIGFQQATNEFLAVGLDKNQDSGDKMYFNVSGEWRQNESVNGSLLIRPRFDKNIATIFTPSGDVAPSEVKIYPNPSNGVFFIEGDASNIKVYDNWGQSKTFDVRQSESGVFVDLSQNKKGVYLIKFLRDQKTVTKRLVLDY